MAGNGPSAARADDSRVHRLLFGGLETRTQRTPYDWDGLRRSGDPRHPYMVFQYTLAGHGCYAQDGQITPVPPGHAFTAIVPSPHRYYLPPASPSWSFFYLLIQHDYIVSRFAQTGRHHGFVAALPADNMATGLAVAMLEASLPPRAATTLRSVSTFMFFCRSRRDRLGVLRPEVFAT